MTEPDTKKTKDDEQIRKLAVTLGVLKGHTVKEDGLIGSENSAMRGPFDMIAGVRNIATRFSFYSDFKGLDFEVSTNFRTKQDGHDVIIFRHQIWNKEGINQDDILQFSTEVYEIIPKLKLDVDGRLRVPDLISISMSKALHEVFSSIECESVKVECFDKCFVCHDKTETKTNCKHHLCYICWPKLKPQTCGICRAPLCSYDDSDDE
jgi:hypothetical protein